MTVLPGLLTAKLFPGLPKADEAFPVLVKELLLTGMVGLVLAGLIAAIISHVSGVINSCTTIASMDFYLLYMRKNASEKVVVFFGKIFGTFAVVMGIFWACIGAGVLVSLVTKPKPEEELKGLIWSWRAVFDTHDEEQPHGRMRPVYW